MHTEAQAGRLKANGKVILSLLPIALIAGGLAGFFVLGRSAPTAAASAEVEHATALLKRPEELVKRQALQSLTEMGPRAKSAIPKVVAVLEGSTGALRGEAALALARLDPSGQSSLPAIRQALHDSDLEVKELAAIAMGLLGPAASDGFDEVKALASNDSPEVRAASMYAAAKIRPTAPSLAAVYASLAGDEPRGRFMAMRALRELGPNVLTDVAPIAAAVHDPNVGTAVEAMRILQAMGQRGQGAIGDLLAVLDDEARCDAALLALVAVDPAGTQVAPPLRECVKTCTTVAARADAAAGLAKFPALVSDTVPTLLAALAAEEPRLAMSALQSLVTLHPPYADVREVLLRTISGGTSALSWKATELVASYGDLAIDDVVALQRGSKRSRLQATYALGRLPVSDARRKALASAATDADHDVQAQATLALQSR